MLITELALEGALLPLSSGVSASRAEAEAEDTPEVEVFGVLVLLPFPEFLFDLLPPPPPFLPALFPFPEAVPFNALFASRTWIFLWIRRLLAWVKVLSQVGHRYGRSPVWVRIWRVRCCLTLKLLGQRWQLYGFSPITEMRKEMVSILKTTGVIQTLRCLKLLPVWVRSCRAKSLLIRNALPQKLHVSFLSPAWIIMWNYCTKLYMIMHNGLEQIPTIAYAQDKRHSCNSYSYAYLQVMFSPECFPTLGTFMRTNIGMDLLMNS